MADRADALAAELQADCDAKAARLFGPAAVKRWQAPAHVGVMPAADAQATVKGGCGDDITVYFRITDGVIAKASFYAAGCGTSVICSDAACELAEGKTLAAVLAVTGEDVLALLPGLPADKKKTAFQAASALRKAAEAFLRGPGPA